MVLNLNRSQTGAVTPESVRLKETGTEGKRNRDEQSEEKTSAMEGAKVLLWGRKQKEEKQEKEDRQRRKGKSCEAAALSSRLQTAGSKRVNRKGTEVLLCQLTNTIRCFLLSQRCWSAFSCSQLALMFSLSRKFLSGPSTLEALCLHHHYKPKIQAPPFRPEFDVKPNGVRVDLGKGLCSL